MSLVDESTDTRTYRPDEGDHDRFAHYARKSDIARAHVTGQPIVALCGKKWVPTRDPERYPICPECKEIFDLRAALKSHPSSN